MPSPHQQSTAAAINAVRDATTRLQAAVDQAIETGGADAMAAPSRLPNWTIGHVVTHLARNADGLRRVLVAARASQQIRPYYSPEARANDIESGAHRDTATIVADVRSANRRLADTIDEIDADTWLFTVDLGRGGPTSADVILSARLGEVEIHHHDLGVDDGLDLLDNMQAGRLLAALMRSYVRTRDVQGLTLLRPAKNPSQSPAVGRRSRAGQSNSPDGSRVALMVRHCERRDPFRDYRGGEYGDPHELLHRSRRIHRARRPAGRGRDPRTARHHHQQAVGRPHGQQRLPTGLQAH